MAKIQVTEMLQIWRMERIKVRLQNVFYAKMETLC